MLSPAMQFYLIMYGIHHCASWRKFVQVKISASVKLEGTKRTM